MYIENVNRHSHFFARQTKQLGDSEQSEQAQTSQDTVTMSAEDQRRLAAESLQKQSQDNDFKIEELKRQLANANEQAESTGESMRTQMKCQKIALRIMAGDIVPPQDHRYLAKNSPKLYSMSIMLRASREHPKKHKRVSEDESDEHNTDSIDTSDTSKNTVDNSLPKNEIPEQCMDISLDVKA